jgi:hypothetical protein
MSKQPISPAFKRPVEFCNTAGPVDGVAEGQYCHRLPMHHGAHAAFVNGNGVKRPAASKAPKSGSKVVTRSGQRYTQAIRKDGSILLTPLAVSPAVITEQVAEPASPVRATDAKRPARAAAKRPARKPRVRVLPEANSRRVVASPKGR